MLVINPPEGYDKTLGRLPKSASASMTFKGPFDFIQFFTENREELARKFPILKKELSQKGMLWVSWPKASAKLGTEVNENIVREIGLGNNLVDVKVVSVDRTWSGLKFVNRLRQTKRRVST